MAKHKKKKKFKKKCCDKPLRKMCKSCPRLKACSI